VCDVSAFLGVEILLLEEFLLRFVQNRAVSCKEECLTKDSRALFRCLAAYRSQDLFVRNATSGTRKTDNSRCNLTHYS